MKIVVFNKLSEMKKTCNLEKGIVGFCKTEKNSYISYQNPRKILSFARINFLRFLLENEEYMKEKFKLDRHELFELAKHCKFKVIKDAEGKVKGHKLIGKI
ncbi:MAG: hypothetical protein ACLR02_09740 [Clostridium sp.]